LLAADARSAARELAADAGEAGFDAADLTSLGLTRADVATALAQEEAAGALEALRAVHMAGEGQPRAQVSSDRWFRPGTLADLRASLLAGVSTRTAARPERPFSAAAELAALTPSLPVAQVATLLQGLLAEGLLVAGEGGYAPSDAGVLGEEQAVLAEELIRRFQAEPLAPPTLAVLAEELGGPARDIARLLDTLARRGDVVRVDKDLWFLTSSVDTARAALEELLAAEGEVRLAGFRDRLGCGRRNAQALLELFDREGLTLRRGDARVARRRR
jgi:selenocysteine-specific elongation factor